MMRVPRMPLVRWRLAQLACLALALSTLGCPAGALGEAVAPPPISANNALEETPIHCADIAGKVSPLIVDWPSKSRLDLELGMKDGLVIVSYTCKRFEVLHDCHATGRYAFAGVSRKEDVIQLTNQDEVRANLPFQAITVGAEMKRGSAIDLALIRVGRHTTTVTQLARSSLEGECSGATHFVRAAAVGAFAMRSGTLGKIGAAVEVFGAAVGSHSRAERQLTKNDGALSACRTSSALQKQPPDQCQAPLQLTLYPLSDHVIPAADSQQGNQEPAATSTHNSCPKGFVWAWDKCTRREQAKSISCRQDDVAGCSKHCAAGDADSCFNLGRLYQRGIIVNQDYARARKHFAAACKAGHALACKEAGASALQECIVKRKIAKAAANPNPTAPAPKSGNGSKPSTTPASSASGRPIPNCDAALKAKVVGAVKACDGGLAHACWWVATTPKLVALSGRDEIALHQRACDLGHGSACGFLGMRYVRGSGVKKDVARGIGILERSCDAGKALDCWWLAQVYEKGEATPRNPRARASALSRGCRGGYANACYEAGRL
ncbi:MAG TPA: sel1 repeat family protein, partial [Sorangium sp.]|nr:sel1 repeat family protein [Sorangium sp.]